MEGVNYGPRRYDNDDAPLQESTNSRLSFRDADADAAKDQADPKGDDERLRDPDRDRDDAKDAASDPNVTSDSVAAGFGRAEKPDLENPAGLKDHLQTSWDDFQALQGRAAHDIQGVRQFHHAAVYAHANPVLADPLQQGPLNYLKDGTSYRGGGENDRMDHSSVAYQNLIITETGRLWGHADPNLERGADVLPHIAERLDASSRHILTYTIDNYQVTPPDEGGLSWQNSRGHNENEIRKLTNDFTDWSKVTDMADQLTVQVHEQGLAGHKAAFRPDEAGLLYATANSAHNELLRDRTELRQLTQELDATNVNAPDHDEKLNKAIDLLTHMDYTAGLHGHASERITEVLAHEQDKADYEGSIRQRIAGLFDNLKERLFGSGDDGSNHPTGAMGGAAAPDSPGSSMTSRLTYPNADPYDESSSLVELTALAFDRVNDPDRDKDVYDNMQALWETMKSTRGDGDFWQAAAYGSANRDLADPQGLAVDGYMDFRPQFSVTAQNLEQRADELMSDTYRENIKLLYSEPANVWQPGDRDENGLLTFNQIHRTLYASEHHMREFNQQYIADTDGEKGLIDWTTDLHEKDGAIDYVTNLRECPENLLEYNVLVTAGLQETASHPDRDSLERRSDETGLLFHTGVLAGIQYDKASEELQSIVGTITDPATEGDALLDTWQDATNTMAKLDYLRSLQEHINEQIDNRLTEERAAQEEETRNRSIMGRLRSFFGAESPVETPVA